MAQTIMATQKKFLVINIFGIGDVLFTTPVIANLRAAYPDCFIGYVCNRRALPILAGNPNINRCFVYERDEYHGLWKKSKIQWLRKMLAAVQEIRAEHFDAVLDYSLNTAMGLLTFWSGIPERLGFDYKGRGRFLTRKINVNGFYGQHAVEHYLELLKFLDVPVKKRTLDVFVTPEEQRWAEQALAEKGIKPGEKVVGIIPGGGASWGRDVIYRRWPPAGYALLADKIVEKFKLKVILLGDLAEKELSATVTSAMKNSVLSFVGETTIGQYLALLSRAHLVVLNDGGPLHMAVAAGARTVSLIGPVDERVYGPYPPEGHRVVTKDIACRPCYRNFRRADCAHINCLRTVTVEEFFNQVVTAMTESN